MATLACVSEGIGNVSSVSQHMTHLRLKLPLSSSLLHVCTRQDAVCVRVCGCWCDVGILVVGAWRQERVRKEALGGLRWVVGGEVMAGAL
jgi:hypothetical protein